MKLATDDLLRTKRRLYNLDSKGTFQSKNSRCKVVNIYRTLHLGDTIRLDVSFENGIIMSYCPSYWFRPISALEQLAECANA